MMPENKLTDIHDSDMFPLLVVKPRLCDWLRRHMIQTNKSTPLPHNSLSLHLFSSCCHQPSCVKTHTRTPTSSGAFLCRTLNPSVSRLQLFEFKVQFGYFLTNSAALYKFSVHCTQKMVCYCSCCVINVLFFKNSIFSTLFYYLAYSTVYSVQPCEFCHGLIETINQKLFHQ